MILEIFSRASERQRQGRAWTKSVQVSSAEGGVGP